VLLNLGASSKACGGGVAANASNDLLRHNVGVKQLNSDIEGQQVIATRRVKEYITRFGMRLRRGNTPLMLGCV